VFDGHINKSVSVKFKSGNV